MAMSHPPNDPRQERALEEAAMRLLRRRAAGSERPKIAASDEEQAADRAVERAWTAVGDVSSTPEMIRLRRAALNKASRSARRRWRLPFPKRAALNWAAAAAVLLAAGSAGAYFWLHRPTTDIYQTRLGERRTVALADGSTLLLDQNARVAVTFSRRLRDLDLQKGQADFLVAKDPLRPFSVSAGGRRVIATGTRFNVDLLSRLLIVTLEHGSVVVAEEKPNTGVGLVIALKPDEQLVVQRDTGVTRTSAIDPADVEAWRRGKLVFEVEPLDQAIERVNRYARRQIVLAAADQARQPISGVFNLGDSEAFADAVSAQLPVRAEPRADTLVLVKH
jgi:transmembrane sensor